MILRRFFSTVDNVAFKRVIESMSPLDIHKPLSTCELFDPVDTFSERHLGSTNVDEMLSVLNVSSISELMDQAIPQHVRSSLTLLPQVSGESETLSQLKKLVSSNTIATNFIGQGYYGTLVPGVIQRNLLENPAWYTAYTPYQAEISQGRLEGLFVFQTIVANLTQMDVSNCSLLDEGTAAAEAMAMFARSASGKKVFLVSNTVHPQTIAVVQTRAKWMGIDVRVVDLAEYLNSHKEILGALVQFPDTTGRLVDYTKVIEKIHSIGGKVCVAADPLALTVCEPPKADAFVGTLQRFGVPLWFGGPHPAFLATSASQVRRMPGRLIGKSVDAEGREAYRLALQTREQHIRLDKATSNICTSQALLANMAAMYAVYHGPAGLQRIAMRVHGLAQTFASQVDSLEGPFFDTVSVKVDSADIFVKRLSEKNINIRKINDSTASVSFDETHGLSDVELLVQEFRVVDKRNRIDGIVDDLFLRKSQLLPHKIFNSIQSETEMMRYLYRLQLRDLSLTSSMISLGSCTMKLNSVSSLLPCSWPEIAGIHPFAPLAQVPGYIAMLTELENWLAKITGFDFCSLQPSSGASGEYAGLLAIREYQASIGQGERNVVIIPKSAHGTNPASAAMMGMEIRWLEDNLEDDEKLATLKSICESTSGKLSALMITYPSTRGVFESTILDICNIIHEFGGNVYMDGANMNAQLGLCSPGELGADVCHLNLHKTFSIPHGGGGPGMGPICVKSHLAPFLPDKTLSAPTRASSAPYGQAGIAAIPWMFIAMLGGSGLRQSAEMAILNANYMAKRLASFYPMPYMTKRADGSLTCSHEFIIDVSHIKEETGVGEEDIAKRLMDYGFHGPTMSWPVHSSLMIEPTESENKGELDRFCDAMISIRAEIGKIEKGEWDKSDNPLKNAPHTESMVTSSEWKHTYSREVAAYPLPWIKERGKFWPSVARVNNTLGDKNLILSLVD